MKRILLIVASSVGLGLTVVPAFLVFAGRIDWPMHAWLMALGTLLWFGTAPFWMETHADSQGAAPGEAHES